MMKLTKVSIIGNETFVRYVMTNGTKQEFSATIQKSEPVICSYNVRKVDSKSGFIEPGQYFIDNSLALVKLPTGETGNCDPSEIMDDSIPDEVANRIAKEYAFQSNQA